MKRRHGTITSILLYTLAHASHCAVLPSLFSSGLELITPTEDNFASVTMQEIKDADEQAEQQDEGFDDINVSFFRTNQEPIPSELSVDYLKANITDFHNGVKSCLDDHYKRDVQDQIQLRLIVKDCAGERGERLTRYYNDIKFLIKKNLYDALRRKLKNGYCDDDFNACVEYMKAIQVFVELNYDVAASIDANFYVLEAVIGEDKLKYLKALSADFVNDFNELRAELRKQQEFVLNYFRIKRQQYSDEYAPYQNGKKNGEDDEAGGEAADTSGDGDDEDGADEKGEASRQQNMHHVLEGYKEHYGGDKKRESAESKANQASEDSMNNFVPN